MANKKIWLGMLIMVLAFVMTVAGCASSPKTPASFVKGSAGETSILLRQGLDFDQAYREVIFVLNRHGFDPEMMNSDAGYIRTRWNAWVSTTTVDAYRVRISCNFNPSRTQVIVKVEAEWYDDGRWISGNDTKAIETLRTDLTQSIGN